MTFRTLARVVAALALGIFSAQIHAQDYPNKPIQLIVPSSPGGSTDTIARILGQKLSANLGQPVVIENKAGAGGNIGAETAAKAAPDGYTLLMTFGGHAVNATLYPKLNYDLMKSFDPVIHLAMVNVILVAHPSVPANSVKELIALARQRPGELNFASAGTGNVSHLAAELFKAMAGVNLVHVPYKGTGGALNDLLAGRVQLMFTTAPGMVQHVQAGKLKALAIAGKERMPLLPDVPTVDEAGVPGYEARTWFGILVPAGTPKPIVAKLNAEIARVLSTPEMIERLNHEGSVAAGGTPEQFRAFLASEIEKWGRVVKASGARVD